MSMSDFLVQAMDNRNMKDDHNCIVQLDGVDSLGYLAAEHLEEYFFNSINAEVLDVILITNPTPGQRPTTGFVLTETPEEARRLTMKQGGVHGICYQPIRMTPFDSPFEMDLGESRKSVTLWEDEEVFFQVLDLRRSTSSRSSGITESTKSTAATEGRLPRLLKSLSSFWSCRSSEDERLDDVSAPPSPISPTLQSVLEKINDDCGQNLKATQIGVCFKRT